MNDLVKIAAKAISVEVDGPDAQWPLMPMESYERIGRAVLLAIRDLPETCLVRFADAYGAEDTIRAAWHKIIDAALSGDVITKPDLIRGAEAAAERRV